MADVKRYYYLKLKDNFFEDDSILLLESMQDGILYSNILLKLYLKSLKNRGKLQIADDIPYTAQMIAVITRHQVGTVERALLIFQKLGLVEELPNGAFYMSDIELLIGQSSTEAERKRRARYEIQELLPVPAGGQTSDKCPDICPPEIELEKEIEIKREREIERGHGAPARYGRYGNVRLKKDELAALQAELPAQWQHYIERLSEYMASTGKHYKSHLATIRRWAADDAKKNAQAARPRDYSVEEGETV